MASASSIRVAREKGPSASAPSRVIIEGVQPGDRLRAVPDQADRRRGGRRRGRHLRRGARHPHGRRSSTAPSARPSGPRSPMTAAGQRPLDRPVRGRARRAGTNTPSRRWVDRFASWLTELGKKAEAGQDVASELLEGAELVREAAGRAVGAGRRLAPGPGRGPRPRRRPGRAGPARRSTPSSPRSWPGTPTGAGGSPTTGPSGSSSSASGPGTAPGTSCSRGRPRPSPASTAPSRRPRPGSPTSRAWASTSSTCRRSTRSAGPSARGRTTR